MRNTRNHKIKKLLKISVAPTEQISNFFVEDLRRLTLLHERTGIPGPSRVPKTINSCIENDQVVLYYFSNL